MHLITSVGKYVSNSIYPRRQIIFLKKKKKSRFQVSPIITSPELTHILMSFLKQERNCQNIVDAIELPPDLCFTGISYTCHPFFVSGSKGKERVSVRSLLAASTTILSGQLKKN